MVFQNLKENFIDIFLRIDDFLSTSTRLSNPVLWCFHTIIDFISSCHDSLRIASKHVTIYFCPPCPSFIASMPAYPLLSFSFKESKNTFILCSISSENFMFSNYHDYV